ncbi:head-tail connector protein [Rhizobium rhizophilum]|uniref:Phage gp6-like head-tail connector protein n=1 Tax=Rhizobium rhizophilum TaxID=1850373 RepID=A0ABY2QT19_9HYPH|nr:head-tail connector protein [Rhizobium rhizophilum]THV13735.1 phage gp6-like head-tail connector protein [Rhizobium rhizophilum]
MVSLVSLPSVKDALRVDGSDDDELLQDVYIPAASGAVINHLDARAGIVLGLVDGELPEGAVVPEVLQVAVILLLRHWYRPADLRQDFAGDELPPSVKALLKPLRDPALS